MHASNAITVTRANQSRKRIGYSVDPGFPYLPLTISTQPYRPTASLGKSNARARMDLARWWIGLADFWSLVPPETFSRSAHDRKSRTYARFDQFSPMGTITEGLNGGREVNSNCPYRRIDVLRWRTAAYELALGFEFCLLQRAGNDIAAPLLSCGVRLCSRQDRALGAEDLPCRSYRTYTAL
jgi:hypothetical protein